MKRKRKGFSLIEVIVTLAIFMIIMAVSVEVIVSTFTDYIVYLDKSIAMDSLDNCMINIDNILRGTYIKSIDDNENQIVVTAMLSHNSESTSKKIIYLKGNNLMVKTLINDQGDVSTGNNVLLKGVKNFEVITKENLIYFEITTMKGEYRVRCI